MKVTLVRHATLLLETSLGRVLVDPMLRSAATTPPIEGTPSPRPNPLVELPFPAEDVVLGVDLCVITHLHGDHFDERARELLPPDLPILTMPEHVQRLEEQGFTHVSTERPGFWLTSGRRGTGAIGEAMGAVCGFVVDDLYVAGDTIWCDQVREALATHRLRAVIADAGGARFIGSAPIVMNADDVRTLRRAANAPVVAVHRKQSIAASSRATYTRRSMAFSCRPTERHSTSSAGGRQDCGAGVPARAVAGVKRDRLNTSAGARVALALMPARFRAALTGRRRRPAPPQGTTGRRCR
jgi:L-ascorbate metabolism protein UlaG (beta-lactamase superfamily)